jgi:hypothetical protein
VERAGREDPLHAQTPAGHISPARPEQHPPKPSALGSAFGTARSPGIQEVLAVALAVALVRRVVVVAEPRLGSSRLPSWAAHTPTGAAEGRPAGVRRHRDGPTVRQPSSALSGCPALAARASAPGSSGRKVANRGCFADGVAHSCGVDRSSTTAHSSGRRVANRGCFAVSLAHSMVSAAPLRRMAEQTGRGARARPAAPGRLIPTGPVASVEPAPHTALPMTWTMKGV